MTALALVEDIDLPSLADYQSDPEMLRPPAAIIPSLAWRQRVTLISGREKAGKTTLVGYGVAAVSQGSAFLGEKPEMPETSLWLHLEGHVGDVVRMLTEAGANGEHVRMASRLHVKRGLVSVAQFAERYHPSVIVIDTLSSLVEGKMQDPNNPSAWTPIMNALSGIAEDYDCSIVLIHHAKKNSAEYRDSTAIGAGVDMILHIDRQDGAGKDSGVRRLTGRGRWDFNDVTLELRNGVYRKTDGDAIGGTLRAKILDYVRCNPRCGSRKLREAVGGRAQEVDDAVEELLRDGLLRDEIDAKKHHHYELGGRVPKYTRDTSGTRLGTHTVSERKSLQDNSGTRTRDTVASAARSPIQGERSGTPAEVPDGLWDSDWHPDETQVGVA